MLLKVSTLSLISRSDDAFMCHYQEYSFTSSLYLKQQLTIDVKEDVSVMKFSYTIVSLVTEMSELAKTFFREYIQNKYLTSK